MSEESEEIIAELEVEDEEIEEETDHVEEVRMKSFKINLFN